MATTTKTKTKSDTKAGLKTKASSATKKPAVKKTSASKPGAGKRAVQTQGATAMLRADHKRVSGLFDEFENARSSKKKEAIVAKICTELTVHTQLEEEIFYPAFKKALKDHELVPEAHVEHASVKDLIAQVKGIKPNGEMFDARVKVMGEFVKHHVKEEETQMFPKAKKSGLDLRKLGRKMQERKQELMGKHG